MHINFAIIFKRLKYLRNWILKKIFSFHPWHVSSFESRPYCVDLIDYMNNDAKASIHLPREWFVQPSARLLDELNKIKAVGKAVCEYNAASARMH